jgi:translation elongation factor EF-G
LDNLDPEFTAFKIAQALNGFIKENVTQENIKALILPAIEFISNINAELVARYIAQTILSLDIIKDNINEEAIASILLPVLQSISEINPEQLSQAIVDAIVNSGDFRRCHYRRARIGNYCPVDIQ